MGTKTFFEYDWVMFLLLVGLLFSAFLGASIIYRKIKLLSPVSLMELHLRDINTQSVKGFLYKKYGVPDNVTSFSLSITTPDGELIVKNEGTTIEEAERKNKLYSRLRLNSKDAVDVFESFENLFIKAIAHGDRGIVNSALSLFKERLLEIISDKDDEFPVGLLMQYIRDFLSISIGTCRKYDALLIAPQMINFSFEIVSSVLNVGNTHEIQDVLREWKNQADIALDNRERFLFKEIMRKYECLVVTIFADKKYKNELDEIFRHIGWLAERLLAKHGVEKTPLMHDMEHEDEFGYIFNTIFRFENMYIENPSEYPLIYFDVLYVLFKGLLNIYIELPETDRRRKKIEDWIFNCPYAISHFTKKAVAVSNGDGAWLACIRLREIYKAANSAPHAEKITIDVLELIVELTITYSAHKEKLLGTRSTGDRTLEDMEEIICNSKYEKHIRKTVFDSYIGSIDENGDKAKEYIRYLGKKMNTNFGLNFDPKTGEYYS